MSRILSIALAVSLSLAPVFASAAEAPKQAASPRLIVNLLDYIASDYSGAVANGKILSRGEYSEQLEFVEAALSAATSLPETKDSPQIVGKIRSLQSLIRDKSDAKSVAQAAQSAKLDVIQVAKIEISPVTAPNLKNGHKLYVQNCVACHGDTGRGNGPAAAALDPKPANFFDEKMEEISPFQAFNVIRVGVPGTAMAPWTQLTDSQAWDLAFYVISMRHPAPAPDAAKAVTGLSEIPLKALASESDTTLKQRLKGSDAEKALAIAVLRNRSGGNGEGGPGSGSGDGNSLELARKKLDDAKISLQSNDYASAKIAALQAYLEGVEPVEPRLRASNPGFVPDLEDKMAAVRSGIERKLSPAELEPMFQAALGALGQADELLSNHETSPWLAFLIALGIILREGFEAALIVIALLAVIRASNSKRAAAWVHAGWLSAVALGIASWFFSGWLMNMSGASRELMEGATSFLAVVVLLYMGFWLHSKTELHRWKSFIDGQVKAALAQSNLFGLALISFTAVFREAFETVLFLRAIWLEAGDASKSALALGVGSAFFLTIAGSWALLRYSARIPVRKVFSLSSALMVLLSVILAGKGIHSFQETGLISVSPAWLQLRSDLLGIYPTSQTLLAQLAVLIASALLWRRGSLPPTKTGRTSKAAVTS